MLRFFHLNNNTNDNKSDLLFKIRPYLNSVNLKFEKYYNAGKHLSVDECMIKFNGRLKFKQFIMNKPVKFGVKGFLMCDSKNYYCHKVEIYTGKSKSSIDYSATENLLINLTKNVVDNDRILYMDSYYTSTKISKYLSLHRTGLIGTIRKNRTK